jgi:uncharacterized membrane protein
MNDTPQNTQKEPFSVDETPGTGSGTTSPVSDSDKMLAGLSYLVPAIISIILLVSEDTRKKPFLACHARQSLGLAVVVAIFEVVLSFVSQAFCLAAAFFVLPVVPMVYYGVLAFQGKTFEIPYLTTFMKQNKWM